MDQPFSAGRSSPRVIGSLPPGTGGGPDSPSARSKKRSSSTGTGKISVEFFSAATSAIVREQTQLHRGRVLLEELGGVAELLGRLELALGMDDLRAALAFGLGLAGHRPAHRLGQLHVLHLDQRHLHAPRVGELVDDRAAAAG